eukprot:304805-Amphidinium_carterae.1
MFQPTPTVSVVFRVGLSSTQDARNYRVSVSCFSPKALHGSDGATLLRLGFPCTELARQQCTSSLESFWGGAQEELKRRQNNTQRTKCSCAQASHPWQMFLPLCCPLLEHRHILSLAAT